MELERFGRIRIKNSHKNKASNRRLYRLLGLIIEHLIGVKLQHVVQCLGEFGIKQLG